MRRPVWRLGDLWVEASGKVRDQGRVPSDHLVAEEEVEEEAGALNLAEGDLVEVVAEARRKKRAKKTWMPRWTPT